MHIYRVYVYVCLCISVVRVNPIYVNIYIVRIFIWVDIYGTHMAYTYHISSVCIWGVWRTCLTSLIPSSVKVDMKTTVAPASRIDYKKKSKKSRLLQYIYISISISMSIFLQFCFQNKSCKP